MKRYQRGLSMVELLIALAIGSVLIVGAVYVYSQSRQTSATNDTVARLQENARYAFSVLEPDIQLAGYYGFTNSPDVLGFISNGSTATVTAAADMQPASAAVPGLEVPAHNCGNNYAVNVLQAIQTHEGAAAFPLICAAQGGGYLAGTDVLTTRRASNPPAAGVIPPTVGRLQLLVNRLSPTGQYVFSSGVLPPTPALDPNNVQVRNLIVRTYYISQNSDNQMGLPALRVKVLSTSGGAPSFVDDATVDATSGEVLAGVEDMQVQLGIDNGDYDGDGVIDAGLDEDHNNIPDAPRGIATRYVNPGLLNLERYQVVSVRVWLRLRAPAGEQGYRDTGTYTYANLPPFTPGDNIRRIVVSRTIQLRNTRVF